MNVIEHLFETTERDSTSIAIYTPTSQASIQLQNYLFTLGYHWIGGRRPFYTDSNCINVSRNSFSLTYSNFRNIPIIRTIPYYKIVPSLKKLC